MACENKILVRSLPLSLSLPLSFSFRCNRRVLFCLVSLLHYNCHLVFHESVALSQCTIKAYVNTHTHTERILITEPTATTTTNYLHLQLYLYLYLAGRRLMITWLNLSRVLRLRLRHDLSWAISLREHEKLLTRNRNCCARGCSS